MIFKIINNGDIQKAIKKHLSPLPNIGHYARNSFTFGEWDFVRFPLTPCRGYFSDGSDYGCGACLRRDGVTWMSITSLEFESHLIAQYSATGKTVIAGLGMGLITLSLLQKNDVTEIIVLENDQSLMDNFESMLEGRTLKLWRRAIASNALKIRYCDCTKPLPEKLQREVRGADYMWVDIWEYLYSEKAIPITQFLQSQVNAKKVDFWGVELDLVGATKLHVSTLTSARFKEMAKTLELPLTVLGLEGKALQLYMEISVKAFSVMHENMKRKLNIEKVA